LPRLEAWGIVSTQFEEERIIRGFVRWLLGAKPKCGSSHYIFRYNWAPQCMERLRRMREVASRGICPFCGERYRKLFTHVLRVHRFEIVEILREGIRRREKRRKRG